MGKENVGLRRVSLLMPWHCILSMWRAFLFHRINERLKTLSVCVCLWRTQLSYRDVSICLFVFLNPKTILRCPTVYLSCIHINIFKPRKLQHCESKKANNHSCKYRIRSLFKGRLIETIFAGDVRAPDPLSCMDSLYVFSFLPLPVNSCLCLNGKM